MTISEIRATTPDRAVESWHRREPPLPAVAVLAVGTVATALAEAAHHHLEAGHPLRMLTDADYLLILADEPALPWTDGARYLGWDGTALTLTTHQVLPAADLWREAALAAAGADPDSLVIVLPEQVLISANAVTDASPAALAVLFAAD